MKTNKPSLFANLLWSAPTCGMLFFFIICVAGQAAGIVQPASAPPLAADMRFQVGKIALVLDAKPATFGYTRADGQIERASDRAGTAAANILEITAPDPWIQVAISPITLGLAGVGAVNGALRGTERLGKDKLSQCEARLETAMAEMAGQSQF